MLDVDPRVLDATRRMLARREAELADGAGALGWKAAFGSPSGMTLLGTDRPLVGFLTTRRRVDPGASVAVGGWTRPLLEVEVAAWLSSDVGAGATASEALGCVGGWSVALELVDLDRPPTSPSDVARVVPANIFHRCVVLPSSPSVSSLPDVLSAQVLRDGEEVAATTDLQALTGSPGAVLASLGSLLAAAGSGLAAGDVVITGSVVLPVPIAPGESWVGAMPGLGEVGVSISR